jgi:hypothetical protein
MKTLSERSRPCEIALGVFVPAGPLTCPECGCEGKLVDMEGVMACPSDHRWWDSNSPEYVEMYRQRREAAGSDDPFSSPVASEGDLF